MPRLPRLDAPGLTQHVIGRGIEKRPIFCDDQDKLAFMDRLGDLLIETNTRCYAWCLMGNHFHLLVKTGSVSLGKLMNRLLGGHSSYFNRRHNRVGHLFQNRYKSIVCQEEVYLITLVRYIHLNPLRANTVRDLKDLVLFPYSGHRYLMGKDNLNWLAIDEVLGHFGKTKATAREAYVNFLSDFDGEDRQNLSIRDQGEKDKQQSNGSRILGDADFKNDIMQDIKIAEVSNLVSPKLLIMKTAHLMGTTPALIKTSTKLRVVANARAVAAYIAQKIGITGTALAKEIYVTEACISRSARRGAGILARRPELEEELMRMLRC
ncbi:MAG TPA: transposase [Actinobacteria bacterium]|nr:transposase [Actinomycetota bacterium]